MPVNGWYGHSNSGAACAAAMHADQRLGAGHPFISTDLRKLDAVAPVIGQIVSIQHLNVQGLMLARQSGAE